MDHCQDVEWQRGDEIEIGLELSYGAVINIKFITVARVTAQIYLTPKTFRPAFASHSPYWMELLSSRVGSCSGNELVGFGFLLLLRIRPRHNQPSCEYAFQGPMLLHSVLVVSVRSR